MSSIKKVTLFRVDVPTKKVKERRFDVWEIPFLLEYNVPEKAKEAGLSDHNYKIFLNRWDALFKDLGSDMENRYDDKGNYLYPANRVKKEGQFFYLTKVEAEFTKNLEHTVDITFEYVADNAKEVNAPCTIARKSTTQYGMYPLYNYHFSAERTDYIEYTDKGIYYMARTYTVVPTK